MKDIKSFNDFTEVEKEQLKDIYFPKFDGISTSTTNELYEDAQLIFGNRLKIGESAIRKPLRVMYDVYQSEINMDTELTKKSIKLKYNIHAHRRDKLVHNQVVRDAFDGLLLMEQVADAISDMKIKPYKSKSKHKKSDRATILLSDLHIGKYDVEIHRLILKDAVDKFYQRHEKNTKIDLVFGGDMVDGLLRMSQLRKIKLNMAEQVKVAIELIIEFIESLEYVENIYFIDEDNHGEMRPLGSNRNDFPDLNLSKFITISLENYCRVKGINLVAGGELNYDGYVIIHGDKFRGKNQMMEYHKDDKLIHGHFHNYTNNGKHIGLPALVGNDSYTKSIGIRESNAGFLIKKGNSFEFVEVDIDGE